MKIWRIWLVVPLLLAFGAVVAQEAPAPAPSPVSVIAAVAPPQPGENVVLHFQGIYSDMPVDVTCVEDTYASERGGAAMFTLIDEKSGPKIMNVTVTVKRTAAGYQAQISFGASIPVMVTGSSAPVITAASAAPATTPASTAGAMPGASGTAAPVTTSYVTYRSDSTRVSVLLQPGQPVAMLAAAGNSLTVTLNKLPDSASASGLAADLPKLDSEGLLDANLKASIKAVRADGTADNFSTIIAGANTSLSSVKSMVDIPGQKEKQPVIQNLQMQLQREPDSLGMQFNFGYSLPVVNTPTTVTYRNVAARFDVALKKLDQPITVFTNGTESVTLTLSKADQ